MPQLLQSAVLLLALAVGCTGQANSNNVGALEQPREPVDMRRELGFFAGRGRNRRSRGSPSRRHRSNQETRSREGDQEGPSRERPPYIDRDRDPLEEGGWERKRVDRIRESSLPPPTVSPVTTLAPTHTITLSPDTLVPTMGTTLNANTSAPTTTVGGNTTAATNATLTPTVAGGNVTAAPTAVGTARDPLIQQRSYDYDTAMKGASTICTGGPQDFAFGVELKVNFPEQRFRACTGGQFDGLKNIIQTTMNLAFPQVVSNWPDVVDFKDFEFDVTQFSLHVNPYGPDKSNNRKLLRKDISQGGSYLSSLGGEHTVGRRLQIASVCPGKPTVCSASTDVCMYGCGVATVKACGDFSTWRNMGSSLALAVAAQQLDCLGGLDPPMVEVVLLPS